LDGRVLIPRLFHAAYRAPLCPGRLFPPGRGVELLRPNILTVPSGRRIPVIIDGLGPIPPMHCRVLAPMRPWRLVVTAFAPRQYGGVCRTRATSATLPWSG